MVAVVEFIGSRINDAELTTNWSITKHTAGGGVWGTLTSEPENFRQGANSVSVTSSNANNKVHFLAYDIATASGTLNFSPGGAHEGKLLYFWVNHLLPQPSTGIATTQVGLGIGLGTSTAAADVATWAFYGLENYPGGWVRLALDPRTIPTSSGASFTSSDLSAISHIGIMASTTTAKAVQVLLVDAIDIGSGIKIYGSGTPEGGFDDLFDADEGTVANRYGVIKALEDTETIYSILGQLQIGDLGINECFFDDIDKIITFANPKHISNGAFINSIPVNFPSVILQGNSTATTKVQFGKKVGAGDTARGRNGILFLGNDDYDINYEFNLGGLVDDALIYGSTIRNFQGSLNWISPSGTHEFIGSSFDNCSQFQGSGIEIRNATFQNATGRAGAIFWYPNFNIKNSFFLANSNAETTGAAIQHNNHGSFNYDNLNFAGNDFDIHNSSTGLVFINAQNGANPSTFKNTNGGSVQIDNPVTFTLTNVVNNSEIQICRAGTTEALANTESSAGDFDFNYNYTGDFGVDITVLHIDYEFLKLFDITLSSSNASQSIQQSLDRNYLNP